MSANQPFSLPLQIAVAAEAIVNNFAETNYQHTSHIDLDNGIYEFDCSGFVGFVLMQTAPAHYALVPQEASQPRPRAFEYYVFFDSLTPESPGLWHRIDLLPDARRGDIVAWRFPLVEPGHDTGHVFFLAETPSLNADGSYTVRVYDSAATPHFEDIRAGGQTGAGTGFINFIVDEAGRPMQFQFSPGDRFTTLPIAIGRAEVVASQV